MGTISRDQLARLRHEYRQWLRVRHSTWEESTIVSCDSDSFYAFRNSIGIDFWSCLESRETLLAMHQALTEAARHSGHPDPEGFAAPYWRAMEEFADFLDEIYPTLAREWSGRSLSEITLRTEFQDWMKKQRKRDGKPYSVNTITAYVAALKNATAKLKLGVETCSNLFCYTTPSEFEVARRIIAASPRYTEIDRSAGNNAYSSSIALYAKFLSEYEAAACWIFQGNPKHYDFEGTLVQDSKITWAVNQSRRKVKKGDTVYIWLSGEQGGILAAGEILCDPQLRDPTAQMGAQYQGSTPKSSPYWAVDIHIHRRLEATIPRQLFLGDERTRRMGVLTFPGATNFGITREQAGVIESVFSGSYHRVPASADVPELISGVRYWLYAPGEGARFWEEFLQLGLMGVGWDALGNFSGYSSKSSVREAVNQFWADGKDHRNDTLSVWQFRSVLKPGDIVYAKQGLTGLIARGIIAGEYAYDPTRPEYKSIRRVDWTHVKKLAYPPRLNSYRGTLAEISRYSDVIQLLEESFGASGEEIQPLQEYLPYTREDFLREVYLSPAQYDTLSGLLLRKKNLILQGPPGVGKTYAATRLCYSIMGERDSTRVQTVQFHQSYSYEDFVMGYRPSKDGFSLEEGPFYHFCKTAQADPHHPYFFIIDEINRGNISKIFGELMMLIEQDKRGQAHAIRLLYTQTPFYVPANVHIIGMMNTADRSLAFLDYALRRRFAFFEMPPAFDTEGFCARQSQLQNQHFTRLVEAVCALNQAILEDPSLGAGFRIGHSYFCTSESISQRWLSDLVEFELLPLLTEYWFDEPAKVEHWSQRLRGALHG